MTVNSLVAELVSAGELLENGRVPSDGGRPSMSYRYNYDYRHFAVVYSFQENSTNHFVFAVSNLKGKILYRMEKDIEEVHVDSLAEGLDELFKFDSQLSLIVFGLPGVCEGDHIIINDYKALIGDAFMPFYRNRYKVDVLFENDINAMVYGYYYFNTDANSIAGIYFPRIYPPGSGWIINHQLHRGLYGFAGEMTAAFKEISWCTLNYGNKESTLPLLGRVLLFYACIMAPEQIILYGDFFGDDDSQWLTHYLYEHTEGKYKGKVIVSSDMQKDYEQGLVALGLDKLK